jgi:hypothetical protein
MSLNVPGADKPLSPRYSINLKDIPAELHGADTLAKARQQEKHWTDEGPKETQVLKLHDAWQGTQIRVYSAYNLFACFALV